MIHKIELSAQCWRVIQRLGDPERPGTLHARRLFPFEHRFYLSRKKVGTGDCTVPLSAVTIDTLLHHRLLSATPLDANADKIRYTLTDAGRDAAGRGELVYDDENIELIEVAA